MKIPLNFKDQFSKKYFKNFLTLFTGSVLGQFIIFCSIPFLTRLFSEEAFGVYVLFSSSVILLKPLISLNFELAIILPKRNKDAINIFAFNILFITLFSSIIFLIIVVFHKNIVELLNINRLSYFIYFIPLSVFFISTISAIDKWNIRLNSYKHLSYGILTKSTIMSSSQLLTGLSNFKYVGLIPGMIIGQFINLLLILKLSINNLLKFSKYISFKRMLFLSSKYRDIPLYNTLSSFVNALSNELPVILITKFFGLSFAGIYGLAIKVSKTPPGIVGHSISQVFFREASIIYNNNENLYQFIKKTYLTLLLTALFIFIPILTISFYLDFIFGENWTQVGIQVRILLPWLFIAHLNSPISSLIDILNKQKRILIYNIVLLIARFVSICIGYFYFKNVNISLVLFSITGVIFNLYLFIYFVKISKQNTSNKTNAYG